jgi:hypothetical protein
MITPTKLTQMTEVEDFKGDSWPSKLCRLLVLVLFPPLICRRRYPAQGETGNTQIGAYSEIDGVLTAIAKKTRRIEEKKTEYSLRERDFWPYAPLSFGKISLIVSQLEDGSTEVKISLETQELIQWGFISLFYLLIISVAFRGTSILLLMTLLVSINLLVNFRSWVLTPLLYWNCFEKMLARNARN